MIRKDQWVLFVPMGSNCDHPVRTYVRQLKNTFELKHYSLAWSYKEIMREAC